MGQHPDTVLVAVDTFAVVRALGGDQTYGSDYQEVRQLKALADELKITLLMVHHVRKLGTATLSTGSPVPRALWGRRTPS